MTGLWLLVLLADGRASECSLGWVRAPGGEVTLAVPLGDGQLTVGSLVRRHPEVECAVGVGVEVLSVNGWYRVPSRVDVGGRGCVDSRWIGSLHGTRLIAQAPPGYPPPYLPAGSLVGPIHDHAGCVDEPYLVDGHGEVAPTDLRGLRPVDAHQLLAVERVRDTYRELFGPIGLERVPFTDWGMVGLPMERTLDDEEIERIWQVEELLSEEQRDKAVVAYGPLRDGEPVYAHFLGTDPPTTDTWGHPALVVYLLRLAHSWHHHCTTTLPELDQGAPASPKTCTLQIGDLAWYGPLRPDPLGHRDHHSGLCVDLRLFRSDGSRYEAWWNRPDDRPGRTAAYSRELTRAFLEHALSSGQVEVAYFGDPEIYGVVEGVKPQRGHDDHIHLCVGH